MKIRVMIHERMECLLLFRNRKENDGLKYLLIFIKGVFY